MAFVSQLNLFLETVYPLRLRRFFFAALDEVLLEGFFHFLWGQSVQNIPFGRSFNCQVGSLSTY